MFNVFSTETFLYEFLQLVLCIRSFTYTDFWVKVYLKFCACVCKVAYLFNVLFS